MVTIRGAEPVARHEVDPPDGPALLRRWVAHGLITQQEADAIAASEGWGPGPTAAAHPRRASVAAEALGYLGAVLVVVAASLLSARYWSQIPPAGRLALPAGAAVLLFVSGLAVAPRRG
ncbi:MAG: putative rane protein, partial [Friedmanniella sp.]|nr:putative rane protein [Friedmanniella sp.]